MNIIEERSGNTLIVKPEGRMDTLSSPELERFLGLQYDNAQQITIDMEKVDYISSAGLRVLIQARRAQPLDPRGLYFASLTVSSLFLEDSLS